MANHYEETTPKAVYRNVQQHSQEYDELNFEIYPTANNISVQPDQQSTKQDEHENQVEKRLKNEIRRTFVVGFVLQITVAIAISFLVGFYFNKAHTDSLGELRKEFLSLVSTRTNVSVQGGSVAFFVRNPSGTIVDGRPTFKKIITNIGGGYDPIEAKFTCPKSGLYTFNVALRTTSKQIDCRLIKNGVAITFIGTDGDDGTYYNMASQSVFIQLSVGDVVSLERCTHWERVHNSIGSTFSGALIG